MEPGPWLGVAVVKGLAFGVGEKDGMNLKSAVRLHRAGIIGAVVAAVCCFTPLLVILVSAVGLSALVGYLDYVLFPALGLFLLLAVVGWVQRRRCQSACE